MEGTIATTRYVGEVDMTGLDTTDFNAVKNRVAESFQGSFGSTIGGGSVPLPDITVASFGLGGGRTFSIDVDTGKEDTGAWAGPTMQGGLSLGFANASITTQGTVYRLVGKDWLPAWEMYLDRDYDVPSSFD